MKHAVVARFYVSSVQDQPGQPAATVHLGAVCRGSHNKVWASATPAGSITMTIRNDDATRVFEQGREYEVTFREVTPPKPGDGHPVQVYRDDHGWVFCAECGHYPGNQSKAHQELDTLDWSQHHETYGSVDALPAPFPSVREPS